MVMFDLPVQTSEDRKEYRRFRKFLIKTGFIMVQESVYSKLALNTSTVNVIMDNVRRNSPTVGLVQMIAITEKQYSRMEFVVGASRSNVLQSDERLVVL
jgi:CRISPR-associated protein Cas2